MPFLANYTNDVFVSYSLANEGCELDRKPWVSRFVSLLSAQLQNKLGEGGKNVQFYFAGSNLRTGQQLDSCLAEARRSAVFLIIGSPRYLDEWPERELRAFSETDRSMERMFVAEMLPLPVTETIRSALGDPLRAIFWKAEEGTILHCTDSGERDFAVKLAKLADGLVATLTGMQEQARPLPNKRPPDPRKRPVLLARVSDPDLQDLNDGLRAYLTQFDIEVLPRERIWAEGAEFREEFASQLARNPLVVQLLGRRPGLPTREFPDGYEQYQRDEARKSDAASLLQWRDPDLSLETVSDPQHRDMLSGNVIAMIFEAFKDHVRRRAEAPPASAKGEERPGGGIIFIDADRSDLAKAQRVWRECRDRNAIAIMPDYDTDEATDWRARYAACDRIAVIHENSPTKWRNSHMFMFIKSRSGRKKAGRCVVYLGPPPPKTAESMTLAHPALSVIEAPDGDITALVDELVR